MNNNHIKCSHDIGCSCYPKYYKEEGYSLSQNSYKDVPGWVNDAEYIYKEMVDGAKDGDHFVEIGTFLGQSATRMGELIKSSGKKITFDSIDLFWLIPHTIKRYDEAGHPYQFCQYLNEFEKIGCSIVDIIRHPFKQIGIDDYINLITCDEKYSHRLYNDNSLKFVWIDGDHGPNIIYKHLVNYWPKLKKGGVIGGDDIEFSGVLDDVKKFTKEKNIQVEYSYNGFKLIK